MNSDSINSRNFALVQEQIALKTSHVPFLPSVEWVEHTLTDQDHYPYTRFYRGVASSVNPIVFEREAGYHPIDNEPYKYTSKGKPCKTNLCFQAPCNMVRRCKCHHETGELLN